MNTQAVAGILILPLSIAVGLSDVRGSMFRRTWIVACHVPFSTLRIP